MLIPCVAYCSYCKTSSCVGIGDLFTVCSELVPVAHKWKKIGLALRLDPNLLNRIEARKNDAEDNLSDVVEEWLKMSYNTEKFGDPSWKLLVDAVAHPFGGKDRALALQIAAKYNGKPPSLFFHTYTHTLNSQNTPTSKLFSLSLTQCQLHNTVIQSFVGDL